MSLSVVNILQNQASQIQLEKYSQAQPQEDLPIKSMTYNLRIQEADQNRKNEPYYWENRKQAILDMISGKVSNNGQKLDFLALQECGTTYSYHTWVETINEAMKPGGELYGYSAVMDNNSDNMILYRNDKWKLDKSKVYPVGTSSQVVGAQFSSISDPSAKPINVFGGHLPHAGKAPKSLQILANDVCDFEGANGKQKHWSDNYRTLFMMDSNDKDKVDGDPSYDHDDAFVDWAGFHDIFHDTHPGDKGDYTNSAWSFEGNPSLREDLQFASGFDPSKANSSEIVHYKFNYNGQQYNPSDHLAVLNTTYFKDDTPPPPFHPHIPTSIQDLEGELTHLETSPDRSVSALARATQTQVQALAAKGLSLNSIEAWGYASIIGKMTSNPEYSIGFQNLTPANRALFMTISGIRQFQGVLSTHGFNTSQITAMAKSFADGTITLESLSDAKFMQTFYANLQKGETPFTAAENAYSVVPFSSLSQGMQVFIKELTAGGTQKSQSSSDSAESLESPASVHQEPSRGLFSSTDENPFGKNTYNFDSELL